MSARFAVVRSSWSAAALALPLLLAGCAQPAAAAQSVATARPPAELQPFYDQALSFGPCEPYATTQADRAAFANEAFHCARLEVPLDYAEPDGRTAQIALLRLPARGRPIGSLLINPGGPGSSGMSFAATLAGPLADSPIGETFDLVGFDPRGVAASTPALDCYTDAERDERAIISSFSSYDRDWTEDATRRLVAQCAGRSGGEAVLSHVGTRDVARDLDILRAVLGDDELTYLGLSYGTRLGAIYAEMFPQNVRALVLDGPMDPRTGSAQRREDQFAGLQRGFDDMAAGCATTPDCPLGADPASAIRTYQRLMQPLVDAPVPALNGRELTFTDATDGMITGLYGAAGWPAIIQGIAEVRAGRGDTLLSLRDLYHGRAPDGTYSNFLEATMTINCLDEERQTPRGETAIKRSLYEAAPFTDPGRPVIEARDGCEHWPVEPTLGYPYAIGIEGLPPTLTVAATGDPVTPYDGGVSLAEALGGNLLTVEAEQHGTVLTGGIACVDDLVADYLITLQTPPDGARCAGVTPLPTGRQP